VWASGYNPRDCPATGLPNGVTCTSSVSPFTAATATSFTLQSGADGNGQAVAGEANEIITYRLDPLVAPLAGCPVRPNLQRQASVTDAAPVILIGGVCSLIFTYFDQTGIVPFPNPVAAANLPNIRAVGIQIQTRPENSPGQWSQATVAMTDLMRVRNR
jgi:hypothetical protein